MNSSKAIGIDLGTTYSSVGVWQNDRFEIIPNNNGNYKTPSCVSFSDTERRFGDAAKQQAATNPLNTVFNAKRLIGRNFYDPEVQSDIKHYPFKVFNKNGKPRIEVEYCGEKKELSPEEVVSKILLKMKKSAEAYLGCNVANAVVGVPSYFNALQRQCMKDAGTISGLGILQIINEANLSAIAYGLERQFSGERNILTYDLGGGNCSVSILTIEEGIYEVKATAGDNHFGGEDFDNRLVSHFMEEFQRKYKKSLDSNPRAIRRLRTACERAKCALSSATQAYIEIDSLFEGVDFCASLTRTRFEELCTDIFCNTLQPVEKVLLDCRMQKSDIHDIVLVGGSTRIPRIVKLISDFFNGKKPARNINPDEAVACGAAVRAAILYGDISERLQNILLLDVVPMSLGIRTDGTDLMSLESEIKDGAMIALIKRGTIFPTTKSEIFSTACDNQPVVVIQVYEGERARTKDNNFFGKLELTGFPPAPRGVPQIEVTFDIDCNGTLCVSAWHKSIGKSNHTRIYHPDSSLSSKEITHMVQEAERYEDADESAHARLRARDTLECYVHNLREWINNEKGKLEVAVDETIAWLELSQEASKEEYEEMQEGLEFVAKKLL